MRLFLVCLRLSLTGLAAPVAQSQAAVRPLHLVETLRLDADGEDFSVIGNVLVSRTGGIVVKQPQDSWLLFYDSTGKRVAKFGRSGGGPGEFRRLSTSRAGWLADTLWIYDQELRRFTLITQAGRLVRTAPMPSRLHRPSPGSRLDRPVLRSFIPMGVVPNGAILGEATFAFVKKQASAPPTPPVTRVVVAGRDGAITTAIAELPYVPFTSVVWIGGMSISTETPFLTPLVLGSAPDGKSFAWVTDNTLSSDSASVRVVKVNATGETAFSLVYRFPAVPIPPKALDSAIAVRRRMFTGSMPSASLDGFLQAMRDRTPKTYPPVKGILLGIDGTVWLELQPTNEGKPWLILDARGAPLGAVVLRANHRLAAATESQVWVIETGESGLHSVVRYRVSRR